MILNRLEVADREGGLVAVHEQNTALRHAQQHVFPERASDEIRALIDSAVGERQCATDEDQDHGGDGATSPGLRELRARQVDKERDAERDQWSGYDVGK